MNRNVEIEHTIPKWRESWEMYAYLIHPDDKVLVVGPSMSLFIDPSLLVLSQLMADGSGELYVADPKCDRFPEYFIHSDLTQRVAGDGNVDSYLNELLLLQSMGVPLKIPTHSEGSHALSFCLPKNTKLDVICDHDLSPFLVSGCMVDCKQKRLEWEYHKIYSYYHSQLKENGLLILQTHNGVMGFNNERNIYCLSMIELLKNAGFKKVHNFTIEDKFRFSIPTALLEQFERDLYMDCGYGYESCDLSLSQTSVLIDLQNFRGGIRHPSPDVYIGVA